VRGCGWQKKQKTTTTTHKAENCTTKTTAIANRMSTEVNNNNTPDQPTPPTGLAPAQRVRSDWKAFVEKVSYKAIVNNIPYLSFVVFLCVLYISNSQRAIDMQRELNKRNKELKELRWKYIDVKSQLMDVKAERQVIRSSEKLGLKPSVLPAYKISGK
jgi:cell division protein FtsL